MTLSVPRNFEINFLQRDSPNPNRPHKRIYESEHGREIYKRLPAFRVKNVESRKFRTHKIKDSRSISSFASLAASYIANIPYGTSFQSYTVLLYEYSSIEQYTMNKRPIEKSERKHIGAFLERPRISATRLVAPT